MAGLDAVVVGAGVIGLTTAICLAEAGLRVRIIAQAPPLATTSAVAGAMWGRGPGVAEPADRIDAWSTVTFGEFAALAEDPSTGVRFARGREVTRDAVAPVARLARDVVPCAPEDLPAGYRRGHWLTIPIADMPVYLGYLVDRFAASRGVVEAGVVRTIADLDGTAPVIVNCSGVGARDLVPDDTVTPVRGQHLVVANPGLDQFFVEETEASSWVSFFPHGDRVVMGGVAGVGEWNLTPEPAIADFIRRCCAAVEPRLADAPVLAHLVGLRPMRPLVRVTSERVRDTRRVHNYGHGGMGVTLSWGCAREVQHIVCGP